MNKLIFFGIIFLSSHVMGQSLVQLAPPLLKFQSVFFKNEAMVELKFAQAGTQIYYTLNNQSPTGKDKVYTKPISIKNTFTTIKAIVAGPGFLPSEEVSATFIKDGLSIASLMQTTPNEKFQGNGPNTLIDNEGGLLNLNATTWLGYQQDSVVINLVMERKEKITALLINCLEDQGSWVFLPEQMQVFYFDESRQSFELVAEKLNGESQNVPVAACKPIIMNLSKKVTTNKLKIVLKGLRKLPDWHPGKGTPGWIFIDEIKVY